MLRRLGETYIGMWMLQIAMLDACRNRYIYFQHIIVIYCTEHETRPVICVCDGCVYEFYALIDRMSTKSAYVCVVNRQVYLDGVIYAALSLS